MGLAGAFSVLLPVAGPALEFVDHRQKTSSGKTEKIEKRDALGRLGE